MGPNFRQYQDVCDDAQAHVGAANTGFLVPTFWVSNGHTPKMCIRASPVIARKQFACQNLDEICIMMACVKGFFGWNLHHDGVWKGIILSCKLGIGWWSFQTCVEKKMTASGWPMIMIGLVMAF